MHYMYFLGVICFGRDRYDTQVREYDRTEIMRVFLCCHDSFANCSGLIEQWHDGSTVAIFKSYLVNDTITEH